MAEKIQQDINNDKELLKHPALEKLRHLLFQDRMDKSKARKKNVRSYEQAKEFGFLSHVYYNQIENGKKAPSLQLFLHLIDEMGYELDFKKKVAPKAN